MNISRTIKNIDLSISYKDHDTQVISQKIKDKPKENQILSKEDLDSFVNDLNSNHFFNKNLKFGFNEVSEIFYITMIDGQTDKVLKEYSKDEALNLAKKLDELSGIIFDQNA